MKRQFLTIQKRDFKSLHLPILLKKIKYGKLNPAANPGFPRRGGGGANL